MSSTRVVRPTEVWMRNPTYYIKECVEAGQQNLVFMQAHLNKFRIDPIKYVLAHYGGMPWRVLVVKNGVEDCHALEYDSEHGAESTARWPIWQYGESLKSFKLYVEWAEEHGGRVIIDQLPSLTSPVVRGFITDAARLQDSHPNAIIHLHGIYSYQFAFGTGVRSADVMPKQQTSSGALWLPNGKMLRRERHNFEDFKYWIELTGYRVSEMEVARNRT
jgi:hypothetical protein